MSESSSQKSKSKIGGAEVIYAAMPLFNLFLAYYVISLFDIWALLPEICQVIAYFSVFVVGSIIAFARLNNKINFSVVRARKWTGIFICFTVLSLLFNLADLSRLNNLALMPRGLFDYPKAHITAFISPPVYLKEQTEVQEIIPAEAKITTVHEGSVLNVRVSNLKWKPYIELSDGSQVSFVESNNGIFQANVKINDQTYWSIKQGAYEIGKWSLAIIDDQNPEINKFAIATDQNNNKGYIPLLIDVSDDRKIMHTSVGIVTDDGSLSDQTEIALRGVRHYESIFYLDLTSSDHSGSDLDLMLSIEDEAGQISTKRLENINIPIKDYKNPLAKKLISLHEDLKSPEGKLRSSARQIKSLGLLSEGENLPPVYYMALRSAYWRLIDPTAPDDQQTARDLLWDIAQKIEDGELTEIENKLVYALDELLLGVRQELSLTDIRTLLKKADLLFLDYKRVARLNGSENYSLEIDTQALRRLYSYILTFSDQDKYYNAALIVDFMRKGLVQNDDLILSKDGLGNYFALFEGRQIIDNLIKIQKTLLASSYNDQARNSLSESNEFTPSPRDKSNEVRNNEIILQTKVGVAVKRLGEKISFTEGHSGFLIDNATMLVDEILENMKNSEADDVARSQSELLAVMSNLKRLLDKPVSGAPELNNLLRAINSKPVS